MNEKTVLERMRPERRRGVVTESEQKGIEVRQGTLAERSYE